MVSWIYPKSDTQIYDEQQTKSYSSIDPSQIKFGYKISDTHYKWSPVNVFRSEYKTYFKMKSDIKDTELPAVFVVDDDNKLLWYLIVLLMDISLLTELLIRLFLF